jgi:hypothetical protein
MNDGKMTVALIAILPIGNVPQAFAHAALINAVCSRGRAFRKSSTRPFFDSLDLLHLRRYPAVLCTETLTQTMAFTTLILLSFSTFDRSTEVNSWLQSRHSTLNLGRRNLAKRLDLSSISMANPTEITETQLTWHNPGPWKRMVASKAFYQHNFPAPHIDAVESVIDYHVPVDKFTPLAEFDGSVVVERTVGEVSARCHDEQANFLALNLMHDIVTSAKSTQEARNYYAKEFADYRRKKPTPYMERLRFTPTDRGTADPDTRMLSDEDLKQAVKEGQERG